MHLWVAGGRKGHVTASRGKMPTGSSHQNLKWAGKMAQLVEGPGFHEAAGMNNPKVVL